MAIDETLRAIARSVDILGPQAATIDGIPVPTFQPMPPLGPVPPVSPVEQAIYNRFFCGATVAFRPEAMSVDGGWLIPALSAANASTERIEEGWTLVSTSPDSSIVAARQGGTARPFRAGDYLLVDAIMGPAAPGMPVRIFCRRESTALQPGYYHAFSESIVAEGAGASLFRIYWNIGGAGAADLVRSVTTHFNRFQVPFRLKCPAYHSGYGRRDAAVLYVERTCIDIVRSLYPRVHREVARHLREGVPAFTKPLSRSTAVAEDPGNGDSFGLSRCRLITAALWNAFAAGRRSEEGRLEAILGRIREAGLDPSSLYLNAGSTDCYDFEIEEAA